LSLGKTDFLFTAVWLPKRGNIVKLILKWTSAITSMFQEEFKIIRDSERSEKVCCNNLVVLDKYQCNVIGCRI
jgi:hypothetical protein